MSLVPRRLDKDYEHQSIAFYPLVPVPSIAQRAHEAQQGVPDQRAINKPRLRCPLTVPVSQNPPVALLPPSGPCESSLAADAALLPPCCGHPGHRHPPPHRPKQDAPLPRLRTDSSPLPVRCTCGHFAIHRSSRRPGQEMGTVDPAVDDVVHGDGLQGAAARRGGKPKEAERSQDPPTGPSDRSSRYELLLAPRSLPQAEPQGRWGGSGCQGAGITTSHYSSAIVTLLRAASLPAVARTRRSLQQRDSIDETGSKPRTTRPSAFALGSSFAARVEGGTPYARACSTDYPVATSANETAGSPFVGSDPTTTHGPYTGRNIKKHVSTYSEGT